VRRFPEFVEAGSMATWVFARDEADRWADVLHTLERTIGWPAMQQALSEFSRRHRAGTGTAALFAGIVGEQLGSTLGWLDPEDLPTPREVDYVVESVITGPGDPPSSYDTVVRLRRDGAAVFSVPVVTEFADGSRISDPFDGSGDRLELRYRSRAPAVRVSIDPDTVLLLDANRTNNALALERRSPVAFIRPAWNWLIWLQDLLLTCTALA
jgi:hypothetical protein